MPAIHDYGRHPATELTATLADRAFGELESLIVSLELLPGEEITEKQICDRLGMGRTPVREALLRLRHFGLIETGVGRGLLVSPLHYEEMLQVFEVGGLISRLTLPRAAAQRTQPEAQRFQAMADALRQVAQADDLPRYMRLHLALQELAGRTARQTVASRLALPLSSMTRRLAVVRHRYMGDTLSLFAPQHADLAQALSDGDSTRTLASLEALLATWTGVIESLATEASTRDLFAALQPPV